MSAGPNVIHHSFPRRCRVVPIAIAAMVFVRNGQTVRTASIKASRTNRARLQSERCSHSTARLARSEWSSVTVAAETSRARASRAGVLSRRSRDRIRRSQRQSIPGAITLAASTSCRIRAETVLEWLRSRRCTT